MCYEMTGCYYLFCSFACFVRTGIIFVRSVPEFLVFSEMREKSCLGFTLGYGHITYSKKSTAQQRTLYYEDGTVMDIKAIL